MNDDREQVIAVLAGDSTAYGLLVRKYQEQAYRLAYGVLRDSHEAESASLEAFQKAYRALPSFNGTARFGTWLFRIVLNTARTRYRSRERDQNRNQPLEDHPDLSADETARPDSRVLEQETLETIRAAIAGLPHRLGVTWTLFAVEGLRIAEIAEIEECSEGAIKSRLFEARKHLQRSLSRYFEEPRIP